MRFLFTLLFVSSLFLLLNSQSQTFTTSGSFTVPAGVTSIFVEAWGAGGAGGSAVGTGSPTSFRAQAGGGGGGAYEAATISVMLGDIIPYIVAPNTGANNTTFPINGGSSSFGGIIALGGEGGECVNAGTSGGNVGGLGGAGGIGTLNGGNGATRIGYNGCTSTCANSSAGGGGGAGTSSNGGDANSTTNSGGTGGSTGGGNGGNGPSSGNAGSGGNIIGGGGAGAWAAASTTFRNGGAGARGQIRISYTVLPIKINSFEVAILDKKSILKLITASETNNDFFSIERSVDGRNFDVIGDIKGAGNSNETLSYEFVDEKPLAGINYYRIKQTDFDGKYSYSEIKSVRHISRGNLTVTPRTSEGRLQVVTDIEDYSLEVFNASGQLVKSFTTLSADQSISIDELVAGLYFVRIHHGSEVETVKITKI
jgi:hypothetical protein